MSSPLEAGGARRDTVAGMAALRCGDAGAAPVLLVPGYTGSKEDFAPVLDPIAAAGFRAVAVDLPGQFESAGPDDPGEYAVDRLGQRVLRAAAALGPRVHLLGHSFGGLVARAAVIAAAERFASLVLLDSGPSALAGARAERIRLLAPLLPHLGVAGVYAAAAAAEAAEPGYVAPGPELAAFYERRFLAGAAAMLAGMSAALLSEPDRVGELAATGVPVLVAFGSADDAWAPEVQRRTASRLGAQAVEIPGAAHSPAVENPAATAAALIRFFTMLGTLVQG
ncbi:MAG: alpha/beta hydrolase, partial [Jatrophihabitans sp.]